MNIVNFTPQSAFAGGLIIGFAVIIFFIGNGRLAGVSGIVNATLVSKQNRTDNFLFGTHKRIPKHQKDYVDKA